MISYHACIQTIYNYYTPECVASIRHGSLFFFTSHPAHFHCLKTKLSDLIGRQEGFDGKRCHESIALDKDIVGIRFC